MTACRAVTPLFALLAVAACGGATPTQPTTPTSTFIVSGIVRERLAGGTVGLPISGVRVEGPAATAATSDGNGHYSIAAGAGTFDLRLSKDGYTPATAHVENLAANRELDATIDPILRTLVGTVTDASSGTPVAAAVVAIATGSNTGRTVATDGSGAFTLEGVWGEFDVTVSAVGYQPATARSAIDAAVTRVDVRLTRDSQVARSVFTGALCTVAAPYSYSRCQGNSFPYPIQAHHWVPVSRPGTMTLGVTYDYVGDYYWNTLNVEVRCDAQLIAERRFDLLWSGPPIVRPENTRGPVSITLPRPCNYEITLFNYIADRKGGDWTTYRVEVGYPR